MSWGGWKPYVSVAKRREQAQRKMNSLKKQGVDVQPVTIEGRKIANTFWGESWCDHLESFSDYANRLPRGRTYVRNGSVCHLQIGTGEIKAKVSGSELYDVKVTIKKLPSQKWDAVKEQCAGQIGSLLELLKGKFSDNVMSVVTHRKDGLFPSPGEIELDCSCPDWADMCKHVAAVLYGVGARLDQKPELLFLLRGVRHEELIEADTSSFVPGSKSAGQKDGKRRVADGDLANVFGIELIVEQEPGLLRPKAKTPAVSAKPENPTTNISAPKATAKISSDKGRAIKAKSSRSSKAGITLLEEPLGALARSSARDVPQTAEFIITLRSRLGLTANQFAKLVGVPPSMVNKWEFTTGKLNLSRPTLEALRAASTLTKKAALQKVGKA
jgi:uncharacterized Zn finger protein